MTTPVIQTELIKYRERQEGLYEMLDVFYRGVNESAVSTNLQTAIIENNRIEFTLPTINQLIATFYRTGCKVDGNNLEPEDYQPARISIAMGISDFYLNRQIENGNERALNEDTMAGLLDRALSRLYPNPNDFVVEYNEMHQWHTDEDETSLKRDTLSYYIDILFEYCHVTHLIELFQKAEESMINAARSDDPFQAVSQGRATLTALLEPNGPIK